ncbi:MAG TPA: hypothetical protein VHM72_10825 [Solirubrobacteraceae bacterium]|nr:hypothetical protein [Solirubrobacteraceae bacterium]
MLVAAAAFGLGVALRGSPSGQSNLNSYGGLPSWLPKAKITVGRVVQASAQHPQLAVIEGDSVSAHLPSGQVMATAVGPTVPADAAEKEQGDSPTTTNATTCTFTVKLSGTSGRVPISARAFTIIDERGQVSHLGVSAAGGVSLPALVAPGQTLTLTMKSKLPEGEYILRWSPNGAKVLVGWEFNVELD